MRVVKAPRKQIAFTRGVKREQPFQTRARVPWPTALDFSRIPVEARSPAVRAAIHQQIHLARQPSKGRQRRAAEIILKHEFRNENRVGEVGKGIAKSLACMHRAERVVICLFVFPDEHLYTLENAVVEERMNSPGCLDGIECTRAGLHAERGECRLSRLGKWLLR